MSFIGVDWSMREFRAWRFDAQGGVVDRRLSRTGLRKAARRDPEETLLEHIGSWLEPDSLVVLASASADRRAWVETPFLNGPVDIPALLDGSVRQRLREGTLLALPGLARRASGAEDLMRREALIGLGATGDGEPRLLLIPGARSRWLRTAKGQIETFRTAMGGELLDLLLDGPFARLMPSGLSLDDPAYLDGVEQGYHSRHIVNDLFAARAAAALDERAPEAARPHLAGLLIGNEIREVEAALSATGEALTLLGTEANCDPHARALRHLGTTLVREDDEAAAIAAFAALQARLPTPRLASASVARSRLQQVTAIDRATPIEPARRDWDEAFTELPLVASLSRTDEANGVRVAERLIDAGFRLIVVSDRRPDAFDLLARLSASVGDRVCIGVRDVTTPKRVGEAIDAGARVVLATGTDPDIARRCRKRGVAWVPGAATVTEAGTALGLGARALVLYPAVQIAPRTLHALARSLPPDTSLLPSGGVSPRALLPYAAAGAAGAVVDDRAFDPEADSDGVVRVAAAYVAAWHRVERGREAIAERKRSGASDDRHEGEEA